MIVKDDAYWAEIRKAVGRGAPSILLGTSTRSLDKALRRIREAVEDARKDGKRP